MDGGGMESVPAPKLSWGDIFRLLHLAHCHGQAIALDLADEWGSHDEESIEFRADKFVDAVREG